MADTVPALMGVYSPTGADTAESNKHQITTFDECSRCSDGEKWGHVNLGIHLGYKRDLRMRNNQTYKQEGEGGLWWGEQDTQRLWGRKEANAAGTSSKPSWLG